MNWCNAGVDGVVELSTRHLMVWWNRGVGGVSGVIESSNGGMVESVEFSNRRRVK